VSAGAPPLVRDGASARLPARVGELALASLRARARSLADGLYGGLHRAERRGAGLEFAGHREYTPGDDLRHLDRHALLRHGRLLVREFHAETERATHVLLDASRSMHYPSDASAPNRKLDLALLLGAALALLTEQSGDRLGVTLVLPESHRTLRAASGRAHLSYVLDELTRLEQSRLAPKPSLAEGTGPARERWRSTLGELGGLLPRGSSLFVLSDLLDFDVGLAADLAALSTRRREVCALELLDPSERDFAFEGPVRLLDEESGLEVETDAAGARGAYLEALAAHRATLREALAERGGRLVSAPTTARPTDVLLTLLRAS
jgi:uncharacterized protein (DUF58 family)